MIILDEKLKKHTFFIKLSRSRNETNQVVINKDNNGKLKKL